MEDRTLVVSHATRLGDQRYLYGVFDGHGGAQCSEYIKQHLLGNMPSCSSSRKGRCVAKLEEALRSGVVKTDKQYCESPATKGNLDGSTCVAMLLTERPDENAMIVSNTGDSRAMLVRTDGTTVALTEDHKPEMKSEQERIAKAGGHVAFDEVDQIWRVDGILAVSRAIGDVYLKPYVTGEPEVSRGRHHPAFLRRLLVIKDRRGSSAPPSFVSSFLFSPLAGNPEH